MNGPPHGGRRTEQPCAVDSVVLQYGLGYGEDDDTNAAADRPRLRTADLTWQEVADSLWLASTMAGAVGSLTPPPDPPPSPEPAPSSQDTDRQKRPVETEQRERPAPSADRVNLVGPQDWSVGLRRPVLPTISDPDEPVQGAPLAWPTAAALPKARLIARALRPLTGTVPSPWERTMDEEQTASAIAESGVFLPHWLPEQWHPFEVVLVVDSSLSMEVWQHTVREFRELLIRQGAFHNVRTLLLDCSAAEPDKLVLRTEGGVTHGWRDLVDPTGRRLVLVISDAVGAAWHSGAARRLLARWGQSMPVAVVQTMPQRLWHWGGLTPRRVQLAAESPGLPNNRLAARLPEPDLAGQPAPRATSVPIPVLGLTPEWMVNWAKLFTGRGNGDGTGWVDLTAVFADPHADIDAEVAEIVEAEPEPLPDAKEQVRRFRVFASVSAFRLAGLLAAAPLNLPLINLVQRVLLPGAELATLAEVLLGGLLRRMPGRADTADPTAVTFEFHDGVREELLHGALRADTVRVARLVSDYLGAHLPLLRNFRRALDDPEGTEMPEDDSTEVNRPHLKVQEAVFRALSGPYLHRGKWLRNRLSELTEKDNAANAVESAEAAESSVDGATGQQHAKIARQRDWADKGRPRLQFDFDDSMRAKSSASIQQDADNNLPTEPEDTPLTTTESQLASSAGEPRNSAGGNDVTTPRPVHVVDVDHNAIRQPSIWGDVMPLRNPDFVGREDLLEQLRVRLASSGTTAVLPETLHGLGGVGKSQTVAEYIYRHAAEYDLVWWIAAEHPNQIRASFGSLAKLLGVSSADNVDTVVPAVLEALRKGEPYSRWILVFDNAEHPEELRQFLPAGNGHIVVTSRNAQWSGVAHTVEVDLFAREESVELLRRRGGEITDEEAGRLAAALGDLPLAVEQAATWRAQTGMPVAEYLTLLQDNSTELLDVGETGDYQRSVAAAWNVPLGKLRSEHPEALALLQVCAFFGPEPISRRLFSGVPNTPVPEMLRAALSDPIKLNSAIREISRYSLAKIDHRNNTLQLHRLVQTVLRNKLSDDERAELRHVAHLLLVNGDPNDPDDTSNWPTYASLLSHVDASEAVQCQNSWVRGLVLNLARYLMSFCDFETALELSSQAWETWRAATGEEDLQTLTIARQRGIALRQVQRISESAEFNRRTYDLLVATVGEEHEAVLSVADAIGLDLRGEGKFVEEAELREDLYAKSIRVLGQNDPSTLAYGAYLASSYRLVGRYFAARDLDEQVWHRRRNTHGTDHHRTFQALDALAMDLRECGEYVEACRLQEETIDKQRALFGPDHTRTIGALRNLAVARRKAGDAAGALLLSQECHERYGRRHGELHLDTVTALMNMAIDLRVVGDLTRSREYGEQSLRQYQQIYGANHPYVHIAGTNHSVTLRLLGDLDGARKLNERASAFYLDRFGPDHPSGLVAETNLASDLAALGEIAEARALDERTLARSTEVLGELHPSTLAVDLNLSMDLVAAGEVEAANALHAKTVKQFQQTLGEKHPATVAATQKVRANCDTDTMQF